MKRGFSASTAILVALLIGILFWVGKVVNPPLKGGHDDHDHDHESASSAPAQKSPSPTTPPTASMKSTMPSSPMDSQKMAQLKREHMTPSKPPVSTPTKQGAAPKSDGMDASYWQENSMGTVTPKPTASAH